jgi:hypothetical protein
MSMEEQSQQKKSAKANQSSEREWPIPETPRTQILETFLALTAKMPRKILIHMLTPKAWSLARLVHHIPIKGAAVGVEGVAAEVGVAAGAEAIMRNENGIASSTKRMMIIVRIIIQTIKGSRPSLRRRWRRRRELVP